MLLRSVPSDRLVDDMPTVIIAPIAPLLETCYGSSADLNICPGPPFLQRIRQRRRLPLQSTESAGLFCEARRFEVGASKAVLVFAVSAPRARVPYIIGLGVVKV